MLTGMRIKLRRRSLPVLTLLGMLSRLVTNVLMAFFSTPRADPKRFEMLQLIASVLSWTDDERERVGLQRSIGGASNGTRPRAASKGKGREDGSENGLENEVRLKKCGIFSSPSTEAHMSAEILGTVDRVSIARVFAGNFCDDKSFRVATQFADTGA
jgi:hypothetical protein